jgi:STAS domain.
LDKHFIRRQKIAERKAAFRTRRRRVWESLRNREKNSKKKDKYRRIRGNASQYSINKNIIKVPNDFSLISNHVEALKFLNFCKSLDYKRSKFVYFDFQEVTNIGNGAITILLSIIGGLQDQNINVSGCYPNDEHARNFLERSGFLRYFKAKIKKENGNSRNAILHRGKDQTHAKETAKLIHGAMKTVWGEDYRNPKLQGMLIELMANTVNHAYLRRSHQKGWYFSVDHIESENKVRFCFVDNGKGILSTIKIRFRDKILKLFDNIDDRDLIIEAFNGTFGSRTRLTNRGKGLPVIKRNLEENVIKRLKVISNNVILDFENKQASILEEGFSGTFYYWELDQSCKLWKLK